MFRPSLPLPDTHPPPSFVPYAATLSLPSPLFLLNAR